ncbi:unnamed protein product [Ceratitis capitata]|uniref:(Mediterranean fruit fly) hypothetical protein n=1 Tax=Ceratitis capitata TaxID=7213 RepID=A0A811U4J1_CERCA|nr:unnamed protein product [Ceratitis capitata]
MKFINKLQHKKIHPANKVSRDEEPQHSYVFYEDLKSTLSSDIEDTQSPFISKYKKDKTARSFSLHKLVNLLR